MNCNLKFLEGNKFLISYERLGNTFEKQGVFGTQICDGGVCITVKKDDEQLRYHPQLKQENWSFIVYSRDALTSKLMNAQYLVKAADKEVNIVKLYYTHAIPEKASKMVNAISTAYIDQGIEDKKSLASSTVDFINQQIAIVGKELDDARDAIKTYRIQNQIVNICGHRRVAARDSNPILNIIENRRSRQPTLAPLVMLHVAERLALALGDAEVELLDVLVLAQRLGLAVHHDAAVLQDVAVAGILERHVGVLLG